MCINDDKEEEKHNIYAWKFSKSKVKDEDAG